MIRERRADGPDRSDPERRAFAASAAFSALPDADKMALHISHSGAVRYGYTGFFGENNDPGRTRDLKEIFDLGRDAVDGAVRPFSGPTPWPPMLPDFPGVMMGYHLEILALALDLPEGYFEPMLREPIAIQRLLHYPPQDRVEDDSMIGIGAHTDYGCLTILSQDMVGGLQVMNRAGEWIEARPIVGTFVINIGDIVQRLTNDVYLANLHRVINVTGRERYSIPFFFDFDFDTIVTPLDRCINQDNPVKYGPVNSGAHKWGRYAAAYPHLK